MLSIRGVTNATNERSLIVSVLPKVAAQHNLLLLHTKITVPMIACLLANLNSIPFDFVVRQKLNSYMSQFVIKQLPVLSPTSFNSSEFEFITPRVLELVYTAWDMKSFADDLWGESEKVSRDLIYQRWEENLYATGGREETSTKWLVASDGGFPLSPFKWNEDRRILIRTELDAFYARLYGLTRDELRYILDPQDVYGSDFPSETFRVLKEKEIRQYGEYRTRRLVLEAWDRLDGVAPAPVSVPVPTAVAPSPALATVPAKPVVEEKVPQPAPEAQPMLSDFGLYKCGICGKMVMGFEKESHKREKHDGKTVEWKKLK
jgi:hypothetical protein